MPDVRVAFLGDAFPLGVADPDGLGWTGRVVRAAAARGHAVTGYPLGVRGETTEDLRSRWRDEVARRLPKPRLGRVVVQTGCADAAALPGGGTRVAAERSEENVAAVVAVARARWATLVVGPPPVPEPSHTRAVVGLDARFARVCRDLDVPYLTVLAPLKDRGVWLAEARAGDGRHPGAGGHAALAALVEVWAPWRAWFP